MLIARTTSKARLRRDKLHLAQLGRDFNVCASQVTLKHIWAKDMLERAQQAAELVSRPLPRPKRLDCFAQQWYTGDNPS